MTPGSRQFRCSAEDARFVPRHRSSRLGTSQALRGPSSEFRPDQCENTRAPRGRRPHRTDRHRRPRLRDGSATVDQPFQSTETIVIVPVVPIEDVYGAVKPAVGGSGTLPCMVSVMLWSPEILRTLPSRL